MAQSDDLLALFAAILRISEVEAGEIKRHFRRVDVSDLARDLAESYAPAVLDSGRTLTAAIAPDIVITGDRELLAQAIINLLDNAQRHTPPGTAIAIEVRADGESILLAVADDGPGVATGHHAWIARRFARLESSRTTPGHGLGLNLVAAITAVHGGRLVIEDNHPGLRVALLLPKLTA